jgi:hypothetical protein
LVAKYQPPSSPPRAVPGGNGGTAPWLFRTTGHRQPRSRASALPGRLVTGGRRKERRLDIMMQPQCGSKTRIFREETRQGHRCIRPTTARQGSGRGSRCGQVNRRPGRDLLQEIPSEQVAGAWPLFAERARW